MKDKVVLVTGSSAGIGEASVLEFAKLGCKVVVHGTNKDRIQSVARKCDELSPNNNHSLQAQFDLGEDDQVRQLLDLTINHFKRLDILVNNAAIYQPTPIDSEQAYDVYRRTVKINLDQVILLTSLAIPHLRKTKGCIINVASNLHTKFIPNAWAYSATKAALVNFTKSIAVDLAPDIRVNSISPGPVATPIHGPKLESYRDTARKFCLTDRVGESPEIARLIVYLSQSESGFITGSDFIIDGGATIKP